MMRTRLSERDFYAASNEHARGSVAPRLSEIFQFEAFHTIDWQQQLLTFCIMFG